MWSGRLHNTVGPVAKSGIGLWGLPPGVIMEVVRMALSAAMMTEPGVELRRSPTHPTAVFKSLRCG